MAIAPAISYFEKAAVARYQDKFMNFFILGESSHDLPIESGLVKKLIKKIKRQKNLKHMNIGDANFSLEPIVKTSNNV